MYISTPCDSEYRRTSIVWLSSFCLETVRGGSSLGKTIEMSLGSSNCLVWKKLFTLSDTSSLENKLYVAVLEDSAFCMLEPSHSSIGV